MENYLSTIEEIMAAEREDESFSISVNILSKVLPNWNNVLSFDTDFS